MSSEDQVTASGGSGPYDPFRRGPLTVGVRTVHARDPERDRLFPLEIWYPAADRHAGEDLAAATQDEFVVPGSGVRRRQQAVRDAAPASGPCPVVVFSHLSLGHRRASTFLCTHLSSHGYVVAALDHSEVVAPELAAAADETAEQRAARAASWVDSRVPDVRFLLDELLDGRTPGLPALDPGRVGIVGHSFGGWTALAAPDVEPRFGSVVALAPGGSSDPKPGVLRAPLPFRWPRDVPTLYLVADRDTPLPLDGMYELFDRTPATKRMAILRRADHGHFLDDVEYEHETFRAMRLPGEAAWIPEQTPPMSELCSGAQAHVFVRGLTLCHFDATLRRSGAAERVLAGDLEAELAARGVEATVHRPAAARSG